MSIRQTLAVWWAAIWGDPILGGLTQEEYEEWEFLGECMDWRVLRDWEQERYDELNKKRGI